MRLDGLIREASLPDLGLLRQIVGDPGVDIGSITMDSRQVRPGALFAAVPGYSADGHQFAATAVAGGAVAVVCERVLEVQVPQIVVNSVRRALGPLCDALLEHPSRHLTVAGVTGTNGKTTTCAFLRAIFEANGWPTLSIGTLSQRRTTPEAPELQQLLADWRQEGGTAVAMEVSSHALAQHRPDAVRFAAGVFTNLTQDHLDYHETMEAYFQSKAMLFEPGRVGVAIVNRADQWGQRLLAQIRERSPSTPLATFAPDDVDDIELGASTTTFRWDGHAVRMHVGGRFNVLNAVAAACCGRALGIDTATIVSGLAAVDSVPGRFERVDEGQPFTVIVDYAHTPDGLVKVLETARELSSGRLLVVFGAGGDRDHDKRPLMGAVAAELADLAVVTSDNPRTEDPEQIIADIISGAVGRGNVAIEADRADAIATALANAGAGDVVVIAGKGHESGQEIAGRVVPFDDIEVARDALRRILASRQDQP